MAGQGGRHVKSGQIIAEIETDKATMEFEAVDEGDRRQNSGREGTEGVKVNTPIAVMVEEGESAERRAAAAAPSAAQSPAPTPAAPAAATAPQPPAPRPTCRPTGPRARR
jgi:pyruvate/2-oxoglutarate dehydrogenase complex dihydrolipoamide acyltransferase (E2) component